MGGHNRHAAFECFRAHQHPAVTLIVQGFADTFDGDCLESAVLDGVQGVVTVQRAVGQGDAVVVGRSGDTDGQQGAKAQLRARVGDGEDGLDAAGVGFTGDAGQGQRDLGGLSRLWASSVWPWLRALIKSWL